MESHGDNEGFKHIPIRIYTDDGSYSQKLVNPKNADGSRKILQQMLQELYPDKPDGTVLSVQYSIITILYYILNLKGKDIFECVTKIWNKT